MHYLIFFFLKKGKLLLPFTWQKLEFFQGEIWLTLHYGCLQCRSTLLTFCSPPLASAWGFIPKSMFIVTVLIFVFDFSLTGWAVHLHFLYNSYLLRNYCHRHSAMTRVLHSGGPTGGQLFMSPQCCRPWDEGLLSFVSAWRFKWSCSQEFVLLYCSSVAFFLYKQI